MPKRKVVPPGGKKLKSGGVLSAQERKFCEEYVHNMGNGTQAAIVAYSIDTTIKGQYRYAITKAHQNLQKPEILEYVKEYYDDQGLNDDIVDIETSYLVKQRADNRAKAKGIEIYNKIRGRYEKDNKQKQPQVTVVNQERKKEIDQALDNM